MSSMNINFSTGSGFGNPYSKNRNINNDDPLSAFARLNQGSALQQKNALFKGGMKEQTAGSVFGSGIFGKNDNGGRLQSLVQNHIDRMNASSLKKDNRKLWEFLHPFAKTEEAGAAEEDPYGIEELGKGKLKYDFKSVSKKIVQSKDSDSAAKALSAARKSVRDLKKQAMTGEHDPKELEAALIHAKRLELVAEKHLKNVREEETAERNVKDGFVVKPVPMPESAEIDKKADDELKESVVNFLKSIGYEQDEEGKWKSDVMPKGSDEFVAAKEAAEDNAELSEDMEDLSDEMSELSDASSDLFDMLDTPNLYDMDPQDLDMLKMKHRAKESRDIAKADAEYLKAIFEMLEEDMHPDAARAAASEGAAAAPGVSVNSDPLGITGGGGGFVNVVV